ncbi:OadG family transporter subunit [Sinanaerobacter chloroacetimidivorans]|jgi:Na+-transporting methylmalonyl-CoA/oxaloacetate decarboxylase gamma subunit|uniref:OadG family protein n=1 Tax=Sinanaerobacter chloroacetimidivorans TaxID=2818044 RepID=A0A8J8B2W1_9FIRM|nr:OadG family transporter subunit [Sinanaerobacter chloroacetimidivorans]MBR0599141.1 OadG family protein [Sinanaerobacter chloroacetimidivorans]
MDMQLMASGLEVTAFGLGGVFSVLILFYFATKVMLALSKKMSKKQKMDRSKS